MTETNRKADDRFRHFIEKKYRHDPAFVWVTTVAYDDGREEFAGFDFNRGGAMDYASDAPHSEFLPGDCARIVGVTVARVPAAAVAELRTTPASAPNAVSSRVRYH